MTSDFDGFLACCYCSRVAFRERLELRAVAVVPHRFRLAIWAIWWGDGRYLYKLLDIGSGWVDDGVMTNHQTTTFQTAAESARTSAARRDEFIEQLVERYGEYVIACEIESCEPHDFHMWQVHAMPAGPIG